MAKISTFEGYRYNQALSQDLEAVTAPPYDVLSKDQVTQYHAKSPYNITHLTRPGSYDQAAQIWSKWRADGIMTKDESSLYLYSQSFVDPETNQQMPPRLGLICALELEDYSSGTVVPHENTIASHRVDRLELMRTTHANLESIYGLYPDPERNVLNILHDAAKTAPVVGEVNELMGCDHKLQQITNPTIVAELTELLARKSILIADGHHRYETALAYKKEFPDEAGSGTILITLTAFEDDGLLVLPTHRLVRGLSPDVANQLPKKLIEAGFEVQSIDSETQPLNPGAAGFDFLTVHGLFRALLPKGTSPSDYISLDYSDAWKSLDVSILSILVLDRIFGIPLDALSSTEQVRYTRDANEASQKIGSKDFDVAFLLSRPTMKSIQQVGAAGEKMPQKSTFFYPKLLSGLLIKSNL